MEPNRDNRKIIPDETEERKQAPDLHIFDRQIVDEKGESRVYLSIVQYSNAIQASLYDKKPKLGSMTLAYPVVESVEHQTLFSGKHEQLSAVLALILVRRTQSIVYASVNLSEHAKVSNEMIRDMIAEYVNKISNS